MNRLRYATALLVLACLIAPPASASQGSDNVIQLLIVHVAPGKIDAYIERVAHLQAIQERVGAIGKVRMWRATLAGSTVGNVIVSIEYEDLNAFAENFARLESDSEWQEVMAEMPAIRDLLSSGLYTEITPD